jgi:NADH-quinone oxidoreductase subunit L
MFAAVGVGAYSAGMYHLLTHAFFKALLFLGAGIVIHALANEQDVRRMGGLRDALPRTAILMWVGTIALIGFWPLSKDALLASALHKGGTMGTIVWVGGLAGAFLTGIYATRLMRLVFYGPRSEFAEQHLHTGHGEAPWTMFWPVAVLGAGTVLSGFLGAGFGVAHAFPDFLAETAPAIEPSVGEDALTTLLAWGVGGAGALFVWRLYDRPERVAALRQRFGPATAWAEAKFYWDELYERIAYRPAAWGATALDWFAERWIVGGSIFVARFAVDSVARVVSAAQSGVVRQYATVLAAGAAVLAVYFLGRASL